LQVSQPLLKRYRANLIEKIKVFLLFPTCQHRGGFNKVNSLTSFIPSLCTSS
jgi:hypothetical protein